MKISTLPLSLLVIAVTSITSPLASAKDEAIALEQCPAPVQTVIRHYQTQATLEEIGLDKKTKAGGPEVYEAKFTLKSGKRMEVHIGPDGKVLQMEEKKPKS